MRVCVVGGPLDGLTARRGSVFAWIGERVCGGTVYAEPGPGRELYRLVGDAYVHAGNTHRRCGNCAAFLANPEAGRDRAPCALCGEAPAPSPTSARA